MQSNTLLSPRQISFKIIFALLFVVAGMTAAHAQQLASPQLMLWAKADDLKLEDGSRVGLWPDASGNKNHLRATGDTRPVFRRDGLGEGKPAIHFGDDPEAGITGSQYFNIPLNTEWRGTSVFIVGKGVGGTGLFYSNLTVSGSCLRTYGWVQLAGTKCGFGKGFQGKLKSDAVGLAEMVVGLDAADVMQAALFANGEPLEQMQDPNPLYGVTYREGRIGNDKDKVGFKGDVAEILIYKGTLAEADRKAVERYLMVKYGLAQPAAGDSNLPVGYKAPVAPKFPPVKTQPCTNGLLVWSRADDLKLADGLSVDLWPNAAGDKQPLVSEEVHQPTYSVDGFNGHPAIRFTGENKAVTYFKLPLAQQEWPEMTIVVAGRRFDQGMLFTSAGNQRLSADIGYHASVSQSKLSLRSKPFPMLTPFTMASNNNPAVVAVAIGKDTDKGEYAAAYVNGYLQQRVVDPDFIGPIQVKDPLFGTFTTSSAPYTGDIAEVLIYHRALTEAELKQTFTYLSEKYQVAIPSAKDAAWQLAARSRWSTVYPTVPHSLSWLGNTFSGVKDWVQSGLFSIAVQPDGTVAVVSAWDERGKCVGLYKNGKVLEGSLNSATEAIATDGVYYYKSSKTWKTPSTIQVQRYTLDLKEAPWPALGKDKWPTWQADPKDGWETGDFISNISVGNGELYVNTYAGQEIKVYDVASGALKRTLKMNAPRARITVDKNGKLWIGWKDGVVQYAPDGTPTGVKITGINAGGLCVDKVGHLLVAENGERQQVITYDISGAQPKEIGVLGIKGGIYTAPRPGALSPDRLFNPWDIGTDAAGNIYVLNARALRAYAPDGKFLWEVYCNEFVTCGGFDPATDGNDIYTPYQHYRYQPGQPGGSDWAWAGTMDNKKLDDVAKPFNGPLRRINGRLYHFTLDGDLYIRRQQDNGEFFIPSGLLRHHFWGWKEAPDGLPKDAKCFFWMDRNADGKPQAEEVALPLPTTEAPHSNWGPYVDDKGGIWYAEERYGIRYMPLKEVTKEGTLIYDYADVTIYKRPSEFIEVMRAYYDAESDTMYLAGTTWEVPLQTGRNVPVAGLCGREIIRYDDWMKPTRKIHCRMKLPADVAIIALDISHKGRRLIAGDVETAVLFTFDTDSGKLIGILEPDVDKVGAPGWIDVRSGIRIFTRKNGEIMVLEESSYSENNSVYRIPPVKN